VATQSLATTGAAELPKALSAKSNDKISLRQDQLHQIEVAPIATRPFVDVKPGIGQISFNEDMSSVVLAPFSGRVTRLFAKVGDVIKRGDPMFELDSPEVVQAQTDLIAAVQGLGKANSALALSKRTLDRQMNLIAGQATSQRDLDLAKNDHSAAEADIRTAEGALRAARNRLRVMIGRTPEEIARIEQDRIVNPTITVNAPIDGTVVARKIGPGQYVRSDLNDPLFSISDLSAMWLKAAVPENDIPLIKLGQEIEVKVAALADRVFTARVSAIGAASDQATRRVIVRAELPNPDGLLRSEMFATFRIRTGNGEKAIGVPTSAVVWDGEDSIVWVQMEPLLFQRRKVKIGREQEGFVQIRNGLNAGELIATRGAIFIDNEWRQ
jgi:cobalt-zinc-cadmium efflux system membrane fusion protein